jgi:sporulation protein YlmC with PRC-barrel domain
MHLSELIGAEVRDGNGRTIGAVRDVRFAQEGPELQSGHRGWRVQGLLVGPRPADRFGLTRPDVKGPWLFKLVARRVERRLRFVDWANVSSVSAGAIEVRSGR